MFLNPLGCRVEPFALVEMEGSDTLHGCVRCDELDEWSYHTFPHKVPFRFPVQCFYEATPRSAFPPFAREGLVVES